MGAGSYVLVTPVRNDAEHLDELVATVRAQEHRPALWVIVDDGSTDDTRARLARIQRRDPWVETRLLAAPPDGRSRPRAQLLVQGFVAAEQLAEAQGLRHEWVVNLRPDLRCPPHLLGYLLDRCSRDRSVGLCSCSIEEVDDDGGGVRRRRPVVDEVPHCELRLWRRECLEQVGMVAVARYGATTAVRARNRGWHTPVFTDLVVEATRPGVLREGLRGFQRDGAEGWQVGLHPLLLAEQAVVASVTDRDLRGVAMVAGYVQAALSGRRRSQDPELREYFGEDLLSARARRLMERVPGLGRRRRSRGE